MSGHATFLTPTVQNFAYVLALLSLLAFAAGGYLVGEVADRWFQQRLLCLLRLCLVGSVLGFIYDARQQARKRFFRVTITDSLSFQFSLKRKSTGSVCTH